MNWRNYFSATILERGRNYHKNGLVQEIEYKDGIYTAEVIGARPYRVSMWEKSGKQLGMSCNCPHALEGNYCKHMAALCMELDERLQDDYLLPAKKEKKVDPVVKPFPVKNTPNSKVYTCFDLSAMTSNLVFTQSELEAAQELIDNKEIILKNVQIGRRYNYDMGADMQGIVSTVCMDRGAYVSVTVTFTTDSIVYGNCGVSGCKNYYDTRSYYNKRKLCKHQLAALLLLADYIDQYNPGDSTDYQAKQLLLNYQTQYQSQVVRNVIEKQDDFQLEPKLESYGEGLQLSFRVGTSKMYVAKNLTDLVETIEGNGTQTFGKNFEIDFAVHKVAESSKEIYDFVRRIVKEEQQRTDLAKSMYSQYYENTKVGGQIPLYGKRLDDVFELLFQGDKQVVFQDKIYGGRKQMLMLKEKTLKLQLAITGDYDNNNVLRGISIYGEIPDTYKGENSYYYIEENEFCRISQPVSERISPLLDISFDGQIQFEIGRKAMAEFYYHMVPMLSEYVEFIEDEDLSIEEYLPSKPKFSFYLDAETEVLICDARVTYGEQEYLLYELVAEHTLPEELRDVGAEEEACYHILRYFDQLDKERGVFMCDYEEENVFAVLENGVNEFLHMGEVYCTERLKRISIRKKTPLSVGVSLESGIMNLEISSEDYSRDELLEILQSYRKKKKYHRLRNGDFLNVDDENLAVLSELMDTFRLSDKEFLKGNIHIPAFRALYLDKLLEKNKSIYTERDKYFKNLIKEFKTVTDSEFELPDSLQKIMRNYQMEGYKWLRTLEHYRFGGILADDMGLGKTLQVISVILAAKEEKKTGTSLIISPASLVYNWQEEFARFAPSVLVQVISGSQTERMHMLKDYEKYDVLITSYDLLKRDVAEYEDKQFLYQVLDEAQYIKNHTTAGAKAVKCIQSKVRYALTGTPIENRLSELWSIFDYLMPGFLYGYESFRKELEQPITKYKDEEKTARLKRMIAPFVLRRLKQDVLTDLPEKLEEIQYAKFDTKQQQLYDAQVLHMKEVLANQSGEEYAQNKIQILAELTKLRQICCDPSLLYENYRAESAKRLACVDLIKSAIEGEHRILLFSQFTSMLSLLEEELVHENISYYKITGSTSKEERIKLVKQFNEGDVPVFLISLKAGGTGLNLVGADVVIHYDPWWNQAVQNQATDRAHRIGQMRIVTVYKLIAKGTIEEKILKLQENKKNLADEILSGENGGLAQLSKEELLDLLQ